MSGNLNKEYIKNYVVRFVNGKVSKGEITKIRRVLLNYNQEEWKKLITIFKALIEESIDEFVQSNETKFSEEELVWKDDVVKLMKSGVNFYFAIFNENVFYKSMELEKQDNLTEEQKLSKGLFIVFSEIKKITSQSPKVDNYHKVKVSLSKKYQKLKKLITSEFLGIENRLEILEEVRSLTEEEIIVLKKEGKSSIVSYVKKYLFKEAPEEFEKLLGAEGTIKTLFDVLDTIADEKLVKNFIDFVAEYGKKFFGDPKKYNGLAYAKRFKEMELDEEFRGLLVGLTNHLNKLADKVSRYEEVSLLESEKILKKLSEDVKNEVGQNTPPPVPADQNFDQVFSIIGRAFKEAIDNDKSELFKELDEKLSNVNNEDKKWYKDPVKIGFLAIVVFVIGGLTSWLFLRRKNNRANYVN